MDELTKFMESDTISDLRESLELETLLLSDEVTIEEKMQLMELREELGQRAKNRLKKKKNRSIEELKAKYLKNQKPKFTLINGGKE